MNSFRNFRDACDWAESALFAGGREVDAGKWQGIQTLGHPSLITRELLNLDFEVPLFRATPSPYELRGRIIGEIQPNLEWADEHFAERVGGQPLNPDPSYERWPWWQGQKAQSMVLQDSVIQEVFTHTYSERFWPKQAGDLNRMPGQEIYGIRYELGDYDDVLELLRSEPHTRQAYLPIFFPEDTGAVHGGRTPCSLGYHFLLRDNLFHMWYDIRSCDAVRHFRDDVYLAVRLQLYTLEKLQNRESRETDEKFRYWEHVKPGTFYFRAHSFHVHMGDFHHLKERVNA